jgi:hypothetical protein
MKRQDLVLPTYEGAETHAARAPQTRRRHNMSTQSSTGTARYGSTTTVRVHKGQRTAISVMGGTR